MPSNKGKAWVTTGALGIRDFIKHYRNSVQYNRVDNATYRKILNLCNEEIVRLIVEEGKEMRIPYLSTMVVRKSSKPKKNNIDYNHFNKTGEKIEFDNMHSDGYRGRLHWAKRMIPIPGSGPYCFEPVRSFSRGISKEMKKFKGHTKYEEK